MTPWRGLDVTSYRARHPHADVVEIAAVEDTAAYPPAPVVGRAFG
jgi:hypothetical protein